MPHREQSGNYVSYHREISSLEENKVNDKLLQFHRKYFSRIYPAGSRVDSSNYDPIPAFSCGS